MEILAYSIKDTIAVSGIGRTTLYQLIRAGELRPVKIGRRTLILRNDLEALLQRMATAG